jgi:alkyl sulfatase BDS1-like metallo-beta-lactamase superfamily hydrolase
MADLLALSSRIIDAGADPDQGPALINRITHELSEIDTGIAVVEAFSHSVVFRTDDGLVVFDTSGPQGGSRVVDAIRGWSKDRFNTLVYTHGHIDHVGGCGAFLADAATAKAPRPAIAGHENVPRRFDRYELTNGYNLAINARQFRGLGRRGYSLGGPPGRFLPPDSAKPNVTYREHLALTVGGVEFDLHHAKGETDDHTWAWIPSHRAICAGDFFIWNFPNAGNPQKVQRYPVEWAAAMRAMAGMNAELFLPAHGLPIAGAERIRRVLLDVADTLEQLVTETLAMMNAGAPLNDIVHTVKVAPEILAKPYLKPLYDEPEFVVRNVWRMYGGWYDGNPANLKPAPDAALAAELSRAAGGAAKLAARARELADAGELRLACHLIEFATRAEPTDKALLAIRAAIYQQRRDAETSLMAKGIYGAAAGESLTAAGLDDPHRTPR